MSTSTQSISKVLYFPGEHEGLVAAKWPVRAERRVKSRYPLDLSVRFRFYHAGSYYAGDGLAVNLSSGGVLVASQHKIVLGARVELSIEWPSLLNGIVPLQLFAVGHVVRRGASQFASTLERHAFRTAKRSALPAGEDVSSNAPPPNPPVSGGSITKPQM
jgi:hypothetical protein